MYNKAIQKLKPCRRKSYIRDKCGHGNLKRAKGAYSDTKAWKVFVVENVINYKALKRRNVNKIKTKYQNDGLRLKIKLQYPIQTRQDHTFHLSVFGRLHLFPKKGKERKKCKTRFDLI